MPFEPGHPAYPRRARLAVEAAPKTEEEVESVVLVQPRRWRADDFDIWFFNRLQDRWTGFSEVTWRGKLAGFAGSNDYLFVTNEAAVLLMMVQRHAMTGKPVILEVLGWSRDARLDKTGKTANWVLSSGSEKALVALYRHAKEWADSMGAGRIIIGTCSDLSASRLAQLTGGDYLVDVLL